MELHVASLEGLPDKDQKPLVADSFQEYVYRSDMWDRVEAAFDVSFDDPDDPVPMLPHAA